MFTSSFTPLMEENSNDSGFGSLGSSTQEMNPGSPIDFSELYNVTPEKNESATKYMSDEMCQMKLQSGQAISKVRRLPFGEKTNTSIVDESPRSRFNNGLSLSRNKSFKPSTRKRSQMTLYEATKRLKEEEHDNEEASTSSTFNFTRPLRPSFQRTHSCPTFPQSPIFGEAFYSLPILDTNEDSAYKRISGETIANLLKTMTREEFNEQYVLIDCRYPYEYQGGHVKNAISLFDSVHDIEKWDYTETLETIFYPECSTQRQLMHTRKPIFYCEYSQKRGPSMARLLREIDRSRNSENYPHVDIKEIYVIDKGYKNFFETFAANSTNSFESLQVVEPFGYVPMNFPEHLEKLKKYSFHRRTCGTSVRPAMRIARMGRTFSCSLARKHVNLSPSDEHPLKSRKSLDFTPERSEPLPTHLEFS
ncbi:unnamed protein product, partial [Mesorhabditis belari]|uniref:protein-tyrosine-phosphatase n=1 Tax=Mesorhabditis belari TaxID=2138241 RepID=A0AAF3J9H2_9BILA